VYILVESMGGGVIYSILKAVPRLGCYISMIKHGRAATYIDTFLL
jgi:hypothetical protein